ACVTPGGTDIAAIFGGGFGPPGSCFTFPPTTCDPNTDATPGTNYTVSTLGLTGTNLTFTPTYWSDTTVYFTVPANTAGCTVTINTPPGNATTTDKITVCPSTSHDSWRTWTPASFTKVVQPAAGVIGQTVVIAGGYTTTSSPASHATNAVQLMT